MIGWLGHRSATAHWVVGINRRNVCLIYPNNRRSDYPIADDKLLAKTWLGRHSVPTVETLAVCEGLFAVNRTVAELASESEFVIKPARGSGGEGILVIGKRDESGVHLSASGRPVTQDELRTHLAHIVFGAFSKGRDDQSFVERRVIPAPFYTQFYPVGLPDIRIILLEGIPVVCMLRVPTSESGGRANLSQGGLGVAIDLESGRLTRGVIARKAVTHHPDSKVAILEQTIPDWPEIVQLSRRAAAAVPLRYLGVDVIVDAKLGPCILEINARPGLEIQNVQGRGLGAHLAEVGR